MKKSYQDKETLERLYWDDGMSTTEIGEYFGVTKTPILDAMNRHGIPRRDPGKAGGDSVRVEWASYYTDGRTGYERWFSKNPETGKYDGLSVHRLVAVSEYGLDAMDGMHVHHRNNIPWDNRPENIQLVTPREHGLIHHG